LSKLLSLCVIFTHQTPLYKTSVCYSCRMFFCYSSIHWLQWYRQSQLLNLELSV